MTRECPLCHRLVALDDSGNIVTWVVVWRGQEQEIALGIIPSRYMYFIHYSDAEQEYQYIRDKLVTGSRWEEQYLSVVEGEHISWEQLFTFGYWEA